MEVTDYSITKTDEDGTRDERSLVEYSEEERQKARVDSNNAGLLFGVEFIAVKPWLFRTNLTLQEILIYSFVSYFCSGGGRFYFSNEQMAEMFNVDNSTIVRALKGLRAKGFIETQTKRRPNGGTIRFCKILESAKCTFGKAQSALLEKRKVHLPYINKEEVNIEKVNNNAHTRENVKEPEESTGPASKGASSASSTPSLLTPSSAAPLGSEVNLLLGEIQAKLNPSLNFASKSQRSAAQRLLKAHSLASLVKAVEYAAKVRGKEFAPLIDSALALADKFEKLKEYAKRNPETTSQNPNDKIVAGVKVRLLTHDDNA